MRLWVIALAAGILAALLVAGFPAAAADKPVAAQANDTWDPNNVSINVGDSITWSNPSSGFHNVCVRTPGQTTGCGEFRNGDIATNWSSYTNSHVFNAAGTYTFVCEQHESFGMTGTITVGSGGGTTTTTTTQTQTQTTPTQTTPTQTQLAPDTTAPRFTGKFKRRSSRRALIIDLGSSEDATLKATVSRRPPGKRSFSRVGQASVDVGRGRNVVKLPRKASGKLRAGAYKVKLVLIDAAGNRSVTRTLQFKLA